VFEEDGCGGEGLCLVEEGEEQDDGRKAHGLYYTL